MTTSNPFCEAFGKSLFRISWTKAYRHTGKWLVVDEDGDNARLTRNIDEASKFTRDECNVILLALTNVAHGWDFGGDNSYPQIDEVR